MTNNVNMGILDIDDYKLDLKKQKDYETALKEKLKKETINFKEQNIKRIEKRIEIIEKEINQNVEEGHHETEVKKDTQTESNKQSVNDKEIIGSDSKTIMTISNNKSTENQNKPSGPEYVKDKKMYESVKALLEEYKEVSQYFSKIVKYILNLDGKFSHGARRVNKSLSYFKSD